MSISDDFRTFLKEQNLWETLTDAELKNFLEFTEEVTCGKGEIIADIGEVGKALFIVMDGEITLVADDGMEEIKVGKIIKGEILGEMSFFDQKPRSVRLKAAASSTRLLRLSRARYERMRVQCPYVAVNLLELAIVSLDHLVRRQSTDVATYTRFLYGKGKK